MMMCTNCGKNPAVVFLTKVENGVTKNEGLCMTCAKKLGISSINNIMDKMGMTEEEFDEMNRGMMESMGNIESIDDITPEMLQNVMPMMQNAFGGTDEETEEPQKTTKTKVNEKPKKKSIIEQYAVNLTEKAHNNQIDRVIGRSVEIERVTQILNRRTKNNPVLIGEPGVGKTAIAEGLAVRIANKDVPNKLLKKEIYLLDLAGVVAGTQFRGQFESRIKGIIDEAKKRGNIIFVIDELHNIVAAGDAEGAMGAANILKPALAKGEIQVIGATTLEEYRKHIEKDSALERRFQPVIVEEPSMEDTIEIIKGIKDYYEKHHKVKITDEVIRTATVLASRYINDRFLPDKAIDVIDEAGSRVNLNNKKLVTLENKKMELEKIQAEKETAAQADSIEEYQKAADLKIRECRLMEEISALEKECDNIYITTDDVAQVIEMWTKIPVHKISQFESNRLMNLENNLAQRIIGQKNAVSAVSRAIRVNRAGIANKKRPVSFMFVGPTGVGKTELVKQLAKELFDDEKALIRLDMSEYMEKHTVAKIIGSPPGYVGYDDAGQLTEKVRRHPYSIILLDEIEKAHPDIFNVLLQIFDDGRITDSHGKTVSFENCVIIMTSNAGSDMNIKSLGFNATNKQAIKNNVDTALKQIFRPEFLNRIDEVVIFDQLTREELFDICSLMLSDLAEILKEKGITLTFTDGIKNHIIDAGYDEKFGARPMRRVIHRELETRLAEMIITDEIKEGDTVNIDFCNDNVVFVKN
ncbi:MAG: AAA family ATPase [Clostridia bacterium]|nr:AAA family ATPase [Clostridia bacterium]